MPTRMLLFREKISFNTCGLKISTFMQKTVENGTVGV